MSASLMPSTKLPRCGYGEDARLGSSGFKTRSCLPKLKVFHLLRL
jgi:hypothetical protein